MNSQLTVIIPSFNRALVIGRALSSVFNQKNFDQWISEVIVVDDASSDETSSILDNYLKKYSVLKVIKNTSQRGVSYSRNLAIKSARSQWIAFLDSDDEWKSNKIDLQMKHLIENPNSVICHTNEIWIRNDKRVNERLIHKKCGGDIFHRCLELCCVSPSSVIVDRSILLNFGLFRVDFPVCEDYDLWLKISCHHEFAYLHERLCIKHGGHPDQLSQKYHSMDEWRIRSIENIVRDNIDTLSSEKKMMAFQSYQEKYKVLLRGYLRHGHLDKAKVAQNNWLSFQSLLLPEPA